MKDNDDLEPVKEVHLVENYSGIEWLVPTDDNHKVSIPKNNGNNNWSAMKRWCEQHCSDTVVIWDGDVTAAHFYFFQKSDAVAFKLRWS